MTDHSFFFYQTTRIDPPTDTATGAEIKAMIKAAVPAFDTSHTLILEGHGHDPDKVIEDNQVVSLAVGHGQEPKHFFSKPPTNFGLV